MMKKILQIIIISVYTSSFSQVQIDTSVVKSIRYKWSISNKKKDPVLLTILTEYKSGFYKKDIVRNNNMSFTTISKGKICDKREDGNSKIYIHKSNFGLTKFHYDNYQNLDSIILLKYNPELKKTKFIVEKEYKRKGKLKYIIDKYNGKKNYKYNQFGQLKTIEHYNTESTLYKISHYKNGLLISETKPKYRSEITYEYSKDNKLIKKSGSYTVTQYEYNDFGLKKIERISRKNNVVMNYTLYFYNENGTLERKKYFGKNDHLINDFIYEYK
ncbi:hypothetical protein [Xanthomarina spongicola]|uniref:YD repeat-containing protein n=1 Tax=Xanthomarina spongicola TaxID=570520 RepID=A0A316DK25_9FLAO|nr:hypothetical protein [Xanthomarina spongicola]PWK17862.1 hypothetical protein LX78_02260 [Xanthomarina spongicola]